MKKQIAAVIVILALAPVPWVIATAYVNQAGIIAVGKIIAKREAIVMPGGDSWKHVL